MYFIITKRMLEVCFQHTPTFSIESFHLTGKFFLLIKTAPRRIATQKRVCSLCSLHSLKQANACGGRESCRYSTSNKVCYNLRSNPVSKGSKDLLTPTSWH